MITILDQTSKVWCLGISKLGECYVFSPEDEPFSTEKYDVPSFQESYMLSVFPQAVPIVKRLIKENRKKLEELLEREWEMRTKKVDKLSNQEYLDLIRYRAYISNHQERLEKQLKWAAWKPQEGDFDIQKIKEIPISSLITFNRAGFARCIWHADRRPSMKYYAKDNHVHCFSCGVGGDIIDVFQELNKCDLKTALKQLSTIAY